MGRPTISAISVCVLLLAGCSGGRPGSDQLAEAMLAEGAESAGLPEVMVDCIADRIIQSDVSDKFLELFVDEALNGSAESLKAIGPLYPDDAVRFADVGELAQERCKVDLLDELVPESPPRRSELRDGRPDEFDIREAIAARYPPGKGPAALDCFAEDLYTSSLSDRYLWAIVFQDGAPGLAIEQRDKSGEIDRLIGGCTGLGGFLPLEGQSPFSPFPVTDRLEGVPKPPRPTFGEIEAGIAAMTVIDANQQAAADEVWGCVAVTAWISPTLTDEFLWSIADASLPGLIEVFGDEFWLDQRLEYVDTINGCGS